MKYFAIIFAILLCSTVQTQTVDLTNLGSVQPPAVTTDSQGNVNIAVTVCHKDSTPQVPDCRTWDHFLNAAELAEYQATPNVTVARAQMKTFRDLLQAKAAQQAQTLPTLPSTPTFTASQLQTYLANLNTQIANVQNQIATTPATVIAADGSTSPNPTYVNLQTQLTALQKRLP